MRLLIVDAFASRPFTGNPAAVCLLDAPADEAWMQRVAAEMNLSETAFVERADDGFGLRWFTPACEVDLCGHATLASAHALWETGEAAPTFRFETKSGALSCRRDADGWIEMDFPAEAPEPCDLPGDVAAALGVTPLAVERNRLDYVVLLEDEAAVRAVDPDFARLAALGVRGAIVTAPGGAAYDFVSRYFAPLVGVDEDPVTGSAHCCLGPFWRKRLDRDELRAYQASARGGEVRLRVAGDRVLLRGEAVTVSRGELLA